MSDPAIAMVKIRNYKVSKRGIRGFVVSLPLVWLEDVGAKVGDNLSMYRDTLDRLVIVKEGAK